MTLSSAYELLEVCYLFQTAHQEPSASVQLCTLHPERHDKEKGKEKTSLI